MVLLLVVADVHRRRLATRLYGRRGAVGVAAEVGGAAVAHRTVVAVVAVRGRCLFGRRVRRHALVAVEECHAIGVGVAAVAAVGRLWMRTRRVLLAVPDAGLLVR